MTKLSDSSFRKELLRAELEDQRRLLLELIEESMDEDVKQALKVARDSVEKARSVDRTGTLEVSTRVV